MNHIQFVPVENNRFEIEMTTLRTINYIHMMVDIIIQSQSVGIYPMR